MGYGIKCCMDCERKGCGSYHDECEKYQAEKEKIRKIREERQLESMIDGAKKMAVYKSMKYSNDRNIKRKFKV